MRTQTILYLLFVTFIITIIFTNKIQAGGKLQLDSRGIWVLKKMDATDKFFYKKQVYLKFESQGRVVGYGGCNSIEGAYTLVKSQNTIRIHSIGHTELLCEDIEQEFNFIKTIEKARRYKISGNHLTLTTDSGKELIFRHRQKP